MGYATALGWHEAVLDGSVSFRAAIEYHLRYNHYPPLPASLVDAAVRVVAKAGRGEWDAKVRLPPGVSYRGSRLAPVRACVEAWHLDAFIEADED